LTKNRSVVADALLKISGAAQALCAPLDGGDEIKLVADRFAH
jgi:hypothetical protein